MFRDIIGVYSQNHRNVQGFLDEFAKQLRKTTLSFVLSVLPSSWKIWTPTGRSSCLHRASTVSKHFFIIPTDAHNYKIIGLSKTIKIPIIASTCFGSCRNHHQGAISCLAKTTVDYIHHVINDEHSSIITVVLTKHEIAP